MCAAPDSACRTTNRSVCIASRLRMVSSRVSPLLVLEAPTFRLMTSADSRLAAISKVVRVRVLDSKFEFVRAEQFVVLVLAELDVFAHDLRLDGQFAPAAFDETGEHHGSRPAVIEDFIKRGADGAARVQHV